MNNHALSIKTRSTQITGSVALIATLLCGTAFAQGTTAAPLVLDGFETPALRQGSYQYSPTGSAWTFGGTTGKGIQHNGSAWGATPAPEGQQTAFLQGGGAKISKVITLPAGTYNVSFYAARRGYDGDVPNPIQVKIDGVPVGLPIAPGSTAFAKYVTEDFPLSSSGPHTLEFSSTNATAGDHTSFLDGVVVNPVPASRVHSALEGFETPQLAANGYQYFPTGSAWVFSKTGSGMQRNGSAWGAPSAPEGQQTAFLQGGGARISKVITLPAGVYNVSFNAARRAYGGDVPNPIQVKINGIAIGGPIAPAGTTFAKYTTGNFPLSTNGNYTLELSSTNGSAGDHSTFIDAVAINKLPPEYKIGVYYFPGWKDNQPGAPWARPWDVIKPYPEREPLLSWYPDGDVTIAEKHLQWMSDYGIDHVVYDWYWNGTAIRPVDGEHALKAYLQAKNNNLVQFSIMWENHYKPVPYSIADFKTMVKYWLDNYLLHSQYQRINGKPVVTVFSAYDLRENLKKIVSPTTGEAMETKELLGIANDMAHQRGLPGIHFVAGLGSLDSVSSAQYWAGFAAGSGYSAMSAYNMHYGMAGFTMSHTYDELSKYYQNTWAWLLKNAALPYIPPMTSGWDLRPWGGSGDSLHDNSVSDPTSFEAHLRAAKAQMDLYPEKTRKTAVICCWNEFGEGSYIEPTKKYNFQYLEKVKKVFRGR